MTSLSLFCSHNFFNNAMIEPCRPKYSGRIQAASTSNGGSSLHGPYPEGDLPQPQWTGDDPLSRLVNGVISIEPLYNVMKIGARQVIISTAEKNGIPWTQMSQEILSSDMDTVKDSIENPSIVYPDYYLQQFHGYAEGNLSWKAAAEAEAATMCITRRALPQAQSLEEATQIMRGNWLQVIKDHHLQNSGGLGISIVLDIGCSVGMSTRFLAEKFPSAQLTGLDLSPYFLAVAQYKDKQNEEKGLAREKTIRWLHANGEDTGLPAQSFDIVSIAYVIHECPMHATRGLLKEAFRLLRPGGTIAITDVSPKSKVLQNLPPVLFTLMKLTEPWMDEFYSLDLESAVQEVGFVNVKSVLTDPRHRTTTGSVPLYENWLCS